MFALLSEMKARCVILSSFDSYTFSRPAMLEACASNRSWASAAVCKATFLGFQNSKNAPTSTTNTSICSLFKWDFVDIDLELFLQIFHADTEFFNMVYFLLYRQVLHRYQFCWNFDLSARPKIMLKIIILPTKTGKLKKCLKLLKTRF